MNPLSSCYIHIPFCNHLCGYCDFVHVIYNQKQADLVLAQLQKDAFGYPAKSMKTIYIGGGTPSALSIDQLDQLKSIIDYLKMDDAEVTMEINPESLNELKTKKLVQMGINRVSVGVQATNDALLKILTRQHNVSKAFEAIKLLVDHGITNISVDAMYGVPTQTLADFKETLTLFMDANIPHISLYGLSIHPNTPFYKQNIQPAPADLEAAFYELACDVLTAAGYVHYEVSNFARDTYQSQHNQVYWRYEDFVGLGPGAASKIKQQRTLNTDNINDYINQHHVIVEVVDNSKSESMFEWVMMNSRLATGLDKKRFVDEYAQTLEATYPKAISQAIKNGWLINEENTIKTTDQGRLLLHDVLLLFMEEVDIA